MGVLLISACSEGPDVADGGSATDVGNTISGVIRDDKQLDPRDDRSNRVADATVRLYPEDYNPLGPDGLPEEWTVMTDGRGEYIIRKVFRGNYNVQASHPEESTVALIQNIEVTEQSEKTIEADTAVLQEPGAMAVSLSHLPVEEGGYLYLPGTGVFAAVDADALAKGYVTLDAVPSGTFTDLNYQGHETSFELDIQIGVEVNPSQTVNLGDISSGATVSGRILTRQGGPAASVVARLIPEVFNPLEGVPLPDSLIEVTNADGEYSFKGVNPGTYRLEAVNLDDGSKVIAGIITVSGLQILVPDAVLEPSGTLVLHVQDSIIAKGGYVYIPGTSIYSEINVGLVPDGMVTLNAVPSGIYEAVYFVAGADLSGTVVLVQNVSVEPGTSSFVNLYFAWDHSKRIIINTSSSGANIGEALFDFVLLLRLDGGSFNFEEAGDGGEDVRFTNRYDEPLSHEIENWDKVGKKASIWVKVDTLLAGSALQYINMYWGNADVGSQSDGAAVFSALQQYEGVWHMHQDPGGTAPQLTDASESGNHAIAYEMSADDRINAVVSKGITLNGSSQYVSTSKAYVNPVIFSLSLWFKTSSDRGGKLIGFGKDDVGITVEGYDRHIWMDSTGLLHFGVFPESVRRIVSSSVSYNDGNWHQVCATLSGDGQFLYIDGHRIAADSSVTGAQRLVGVWRIGADNLSTWENEPASYYFGGIMDEVRVKYRAVSEAWVKMCYENQKPNSTVVEMR
jgi:hypothetical protein